MTTPNPRIYGKDMSGARCAQEQNQPARCGFFIGENMNIEMIEQSKTEITEYSNTEAGLIDLRARMAGVEYDVMTVKGMAVAKADRAYVRGLRTGLESMRKHIKAPALAHCKLIDAEAARITAELLKLEEPIDAQIKAREAALEAEKAARELAERQRITAIHERISVIRGHHALALQCRTAAAVERLLDRLVEYWMESTPLTFEEFEEEAQATYNNVYEVLSQCILQKNAEEAEQARIKAEQAEAAAALAAARVELELAKAEQDRINKANRDAAFAEADRLATERQKLADEAAAQRQAAQAELDRQRAEIAAQRAELEALMAAQVVEPGEAPALVEPAPAAIEAVAESIVFLDRQPSAQELIQAIAEKFNVDEILAAQWLDSVDFTTYY